MRQGLLSAFNSELAQCLAYRRCSILSKPLWNEEINKNFGKPGSTLTQKLFVDELSQDCSFLRAEWAAPEIGSRIPGSPFPNVPVESVVQVGTWQLFWSLVAERLLENCSSEPHEPSSHRRASPSQRMIK